MHTGPIFAWRDDLKVISCLECGYNHLDPLPDATAVDDYYTQDQFYATHGSPDWFSKNKTEHTAGWWQTRYDYECSKLYQRRFKPKVVDIGAGDGWWLQHYRERGGVAWGTELSQSARDASVVEWWLKPSIGELCKHWNSMYITRNVTDSVHMALVLEHVHDPVKFLLTAKKAFMGPTGRMQVIVPNEGNPLQRKVEARYGSAWYVQKPHVNYFTKQSIVNLFTACGLKVLDQSATFPIELLYLLGWKYIGDDVVGAKCHKFRLHFEKALGQQAFRLYHMLHHTLGWGRETMVTGEAV
jgi:2-polyprenyl-3-methyl-5-hydroxy-6-metoxy-1,4-benzoquinol methylase